MNKNKIRVLLFASVFLFLAGLSSDTASAMTPQQCYDQQGLCYEKTMFGDGCDNSTQLYKGDCDITGSRQGCCVDKSKVTSLTKAACESSSSNFCTNRECSSIGQNFVGLCSDVPGYNCCTRTGTGAGYENNGSSTSNGTTGQLNYQLLEKIPGAENAGSDLKSYLEALYTIALVLVTLSAVLMLSVGGFMYLTSAGNTAQMGSAKGIILDALIGLIIALFAWLLLYVINPDFTTGSMNGLSPTPVATPIPGPTPAPTPVPTGVGAGCSGYGVSGISSSQCNDTSQELADILSCMYQKYPSAKISSISDGDGFETCKAKTCSCPPGKKTCNCPPCDHAQTSCHYGGGASRTDTTCQKSHAADFSVKNAQGRYDVTIASAIKSAAAACGARINDETQKPGVPPHIHISTKTNCCSL